MTQKRQISGNTGEREPKKSPAEKPVSLHPLDFKEAVKGLLRVKPARGKEAGGTRGGGSDG